MSVEFEDYSIRVKTALNDGAIKGLYEAGNEIKSQVQRLTRVDTGHLKDNWKLHVDDSAYEATIGNPLQNAIWEEYGTGEYAAAGDGTPGFHGKKPNRALARGFAEKRNIAVKLIERAIKEAMK